MTDRFAGSSDQVSAPSRIAYAVTPHDTDELNPLPKARYVGSAGDLIVRSVGDATDTTVSAPAGTILPIRARYVRAASTASNIVALA